jgi:isoamylase
MICFVALECAAHACRAVPCAAAPGDVWHVALAGLPHVGVCYGYRVSGDGGWDAGLRWDASRALLDPYAPLVNGRRQFGVRDGVEHFAGQAGSRFTGTFDFDSAPFDWGDEEAVRPRYSLADLTIYEMPVRGFTAHESSGLPPELRGTFLGVAEKASYLAELGVTAVELLPVFEWDELEFRRTRNPRDHMTNVWGYSHINFFAPMSRFAAGGAGPAAAAREFKHMVKT